MTFDGRFNSDLHKIKLLIYFLGFLQHPPFPGLWVYGVFHPDITQNILLGEPHNGNGYAGKTPCLLRSPRNVDGNRTLPFWYWNSFWYSVVVVLEPNSDVEEHGRDRTGGDIKHNLDFILWGLYFLPAL